MESALREGGREPGLRLIETMLWDGRAYPRLALHLDRLARGRRILGWGQAGDGFESGLDMPRPARPARVRVTVGAGGDAVWQVGDLPLHAPVWRLGLAAARLWSGDPWLGLKSTRREVYDAARAALPAEIDEAIFLNERGEVCDGTITTVFFDRGQGMRTPPLTCGLLPGVLRAEMSVPEEVLRPQDLPGVNLWVGNALRGLIPAVWSAA